MVPAVEIVRYLSIPEQVLSLFASFGGFLTAVSIIWGCLFPQKYPRSIVAVTYDERTLLGQASADHEVPLSWDEISTFRCFTSKPTATSRAREAVELTPRVDILSSE